MLSYPRHTEGARHHGLRVTYRCREGRYQQPRGDQAGHNHELCYSVSHIHWRAGTGPCRTYSFARESTKYITSRTIALACPWHIWLPHLWEHPQEKRV